MSAGAIYQVVAEEAAAFRGSWLNQPMKPDTASPYWDRDLPAGVVANEGVLWNGVGTGFPRLTEQPVLQFGGARPSDLYLLGRGLWLLTTRAKERFEGLDPTAFQFVEASVVRRGGAEAERYWLCDVVRYVDALDAKASGLEIEVRPDGVQFMNTLKSANLKLREVAVARHHVFRVAKTGGLVAASEVFRRLVREQPKLRGLNCIPWATLSR